MITDHFCLQNRLFQTSQTGGQWYSDTSPFSIPCAECPNAECTNAECHCAECHFAECRGAFGATQLTFLHFLLVQQKMGSVILKLHCIRLWIFATMKHSLTLSR